MSGEVDKKKVPLALAALGVVFGDIGTSPLYAYQTALWELKHLDRAGVLGIASLIIWSLIIIVTFKYVFIVMRADYRGEGGVFALLAKLNEKLGKPHGFKLPLYALLLLFGAALLFGDGTITPAISVLSAMEGLEAIHPSLEAYIIPGTVAILAALFAVQRFGTGRLGMIFGWVMLLWFLVIGIMGLFWIVKRPEVLMAFNPYYAIDLVQRSGWHVALMLMGAVVLSVTGVEALYADMGHFGRPAISLAWHTIALPALLLNYLGQSAVTLSDLRRYQEDADPFFSMVPTGLPMVLLVILATMATVIASQALISGVFSLTAQAQQLEFVPKFQVLHTSREERGQVYVPITNWLLGGACILLVLTFQHSKNLAAAYGLAVVGTMVITTITLGLVARKCWDWSLWKVVLLLTVLLCVEIPFFVACLTKFPDGGYFPLIVAAILMALMLTWHKGRAIILQHMRSCPSSVEELSAQLENGTALSTTGQLVFLTSNSNPRYAAARAFELLRRGGSLRDQVVLMSLVNAMESDVDMKERIEVREISPKLWHIVAMHGYMQEPHAPEILDRAHELSGGKIRQNSHNTFFILPRELIVEYVGHRMARWQRGLFGLLSRNVSHAPDYFYIPHTQINEFTWMMRA